MSERKGQSIVIQLAPSSSRSSSSSSPLSTGQCVTSGFNVPTIQQLAEAQPPPSLQYERLKCPIDFSKPDKVGYFMEDIITGRDTWSRSLEKIFEVDPNQHAGVIQEWSQLVHPDDRQKAVDEQIQGMKDGVYHSQYRVVLPSGKTKLIRACGFVLFDTEHRGRIVLGVNEDITPSSWTPGSATYSTPKGK